MRVLLRADAGVIQGTGHVMRCLTLAEELLARGHHVDLMTAPIGVGWLADAVAASGVGRLPVEQDALPTDAIILAAYDRVVVDSYRIDAAAISRLAAVLPVLAIVDGDDRGIDAALYLDQNLGAEEAVRPATTRGRYLAGSSYALVRRDVLAGRRPEPWEFRTPIPSVLAFMGGTDPNGSIVAVCESIAAAAAASRITVVTPPAFHQAVAERIDATILSPTPALPRLLAESDIVVSAAGTSAWDVCALGLPAILVAVVDNQSESLAQAVTRGVALGVDAVGAGPSGLAPLGDLLAELLADRELRRRLSTAATGAFDGLGASRVAHRLEQAGMAG